MKLIARYALCINLITLVSCGGQSPSGTQSLPQAKMVDHNHVRSWMLAEVKHDDLLYVSDINGVQVFSYPGLKPVGQLDAVSYGMCSDRAGNVFMTTESGAAVVEFAHGGTEPIQTFDDTSIEFSPYDCSVDPTTNNLAVTSLDAGFFLIF